MPAMDKKGKVARWGNSLALRIPNEAARKLGLREGSEVSFVVSERTMTIRRTRDITTLDQLLEGVTPEISGGEIDSGPDVGREAW